MKRPDDDLKTDLPHVSLVAVTSVGLAATVDALKKSMAQARFGEVLLLSDKKPPVVDDTRISWRRIAPLASRVDYSRFMLRELAAHVSSPHALCVQWDGFVLNGRAWRSEFLDYDFIGAVWPHFGDGRNVGNGGFSLRSRRLLEACTSLPFDGSTAEDVLIGRTFREQLEDRGIRFAPESVARKFAYERTAPDGDEFGFHGAFNLVRYLAPTAAARLFKSLEPIILTRNERLEILRWAVTRGRVGLALQMLARLP